VSELLDAGGRSSELGLLVAHDRYDGQAPAAGVVTGIGRVEGRPVVVGRQRRDGEGWRLVAGDNPEDPAALRKWRCAIRLPIIYLVDSAGLNLPLQDGIFPASAAPGVSSTTTR
jgi:acetyl-CoA carboxylase carboxyltransferase component